MCVCVCVCVICFLLGKKLRELSNSDKTLQRDGDAREPMTSHYADVSRAWDIMDIMNNIECTYMYRLHVHYMTLLRMDVYCIRNM